MNAVTPRQLVNAVRISAIAGNQPIYVHIPEDGEIEDIADVLRISLGDTVHVGFGGRVSDGRLADVLPDEVYDDSNPQTVVMEIYDNPSSALMAAHLQVMIERGGIPLGTRFVILSKEKKPTIPFPLLNKLTHLEAKMPLRIVAK